MSDVEEHTSGSQSGHPEKKKKRIRACDCCRRKKVRCDGSENERQPCSNCVLSREQCIYSPSKPRKNRAVDEEYVRALESEVTRLRFRVQELEAKLATNEARLASYEARRTRKEGPLPLITPPVLQYPAVKAEDPDGDGFLEGFKCMSLNDRHHTRFLGRSSHYPLIKAAMRMRMKHHFTEGNETNPQDVAAVFTRRRPEFWFHIADTIPPEPPYTDFPDPALMHILLDSYFSNTHVDFPMLHKPTFYQSVASGLHLVDEGFGAVLLLVCALGSRFSRHPASLPPGARNWQLAGWQWFDAVRVRRKLIPFAATTLYDLQVAALAAAYVGTLALPHTNYAIIGHGLRLAQDLGAHRRMTYGAVPTVEDELRKRAFWSLVALDRGMCSILGRSCGIQAEDFDVDYPIDCDDECWQPKDPNLAFKQPSGKPSAAGHFVYYLTLTDIQAHAMRDLYSLRGSDYLKDPERARQIVAGLDSELNNWSDSLPTYLKYNPQREDLPFAAQAASLHASYHMLRIFIHRPFITIPRAVPVPFPSLAICTNAARAVIQVLERYFALAGPGLVCQYHLQGSLFTAALILLLHVWQGAPTDAEAELEHVRRALRVLKSLELHWDAAGRFWDMLQDLIGAVEASQHTDDGQSSRHSVMPVAVLPTDDVPAYTLPGQPLQNGSFDLPATYANPAAPAPANYGLPTAFAPNSAPPWGTGGPARQVPPSDAELQAIFADLLPVLPAQQDEGSAFLAQQVFWSNGFSAEAGAPELPSGQAAVVMFDWGSM